jgi:hypothetical protein
MNRADLQSSNSLFGLERNSISETSVRGPLGKATQCRAGPANEARPRGCGSSNMLDNTDHIWSADTWGRAAHSGLAGGALKSRRPHPLIALFYYEVGSVPEYKHCTTVGVIKLPSETVTPPAVILILSPLPPFTVTLLALTASQTEKKTSP